MADVKWIKIVADIFGDDKILLLETLPESDSIIVIWFKLLCMAGKQNNHGVFMLNERIAYDYKMLATIFKRNENTVKLALDAFEKFGMIEVVDGVITIPNWGKHQNFDKIEKSNEYMRNYMRNYREKQKQIACKTNVSALDKIRLDKNINNSCASDDGTKDEITPQTICMENFEKIYAIYPLKKGKQDAFKHYKSWGNGNKKNDCGIKRLSNKQMYLAVSRYVDEVRENGKIEFIKHFSTFMNNGIIDYLEEVE